jgi:hypothetical protein
MNPYMNEDAMWQRLKDLQTEAENRRFYGPQRPRLLDVVRLFSRRVWLLAGLAMRRPPRRTWVDPTAKRSKVA